MVKGLRKTSKNPPILSHEFIIQNHADIVSCVAMVFVVGIMIKATAPFASIFVALQHNTTYPETVEDVLLYAPGIKDWAAIFFYSLIAVVVHAIFQEYLLDKISKKLHLSKSKLAVFNNSGQLVVFYLLSVIWGLDIIMRERYLPEISRLWSEYPAPMIFFTKLYFIVQLSYSLHELPELYFQRVKKEEYLGKALSSLAGLVLISIPYFMSFNRLLVCLLVLHHTSELIFHISQLVQTVDKDEKLTKASTLVSTALRFTARLGSIIISVFTLWYGLALSEQKELNIQEGYYNVAPVRLSILGGILLLQLYLIFNLISDEISRSKENSAYIPAPKSKSKKEKSKKNKKNQDESDLPEVDQNTNKTLRNKLKTK
ncbi:translocating chain-associated membrane protein 1 isoform X2 [Harmonia axyridis]|uniref:translocating chain-associated membrane protein 1 isoform X2 n=1 Tax=Harmonia axyridis TaxID=115357 RepID=UPI001E2773FD|nr:translocating chain-associated membrane protein 1 isoform X2 [Harmonia axyridis]